MANAKSTTPSPLKNMAPFDIQPLFAVNQRSFQAAAEANAQAMKRMSRVSEEMFRFVDQRLKQDRDVVKEFATCKSPQDAASVCGEFFQTAVQQYSEELGRLAGLYADQTIEALDDAQRQVDQAMINDEEQGRATDE